MKLKTTLLAVTLAVFAASSAFAADEAVTPAAEKAEAKKPAKRHNHMEEKTGMPMPAPKASGESAPQKSENAEPKKPAKRHNHATDR
jgi:hypothetical protein